MFERFQSEENAQEKNKLLYGLGKTMKPNDVTGFFYFSTPLVGCQTTLKLKQPTSGTQSFDALGIFSKTATFIPFNYN